MVLSLRSFLFIEHLPFLLWNQNLPFSRLLPTQKDWRRKKRIRKENEGKRKGEKGEKKGKGEGSGGRERKQKREQAEKHKGV